MPSEQKSGHDRTMRTHEEMRMRDVQRASSQREPHVDRNSIRVAQVVGVKADGSIRLDAFSDSDTNVGQYFSCLNGTSPKVGDTVFYSYVNDTPFVLGQMPDFHTPWRMPQTHARDTYYFEEFDYASGTPSIGAHDWIIISAGGVWAQNPGDADHPGVITLQTGASVGQYVAVAPKLGTGMPAESFHQVGFGWYGVANGIGTSGQALVGLIDNASTLANYILALTNAAAPYNVVAQIRVASGTAVTVDTGIPYVDNTWYRCVFTHTGEGLWLLTVTDVANRLQSTVVLNNCPINALLFPFARAYPLVAGTRYTHLDYCWWSRQGLAR